MLPKNRRISKILFPNRKSRNKAFFSEQFDIFLYPNKGVSRFSVIVPKNVSKSAVKRNTLRRKLYGYIETQPISHGYLVVVRVKPQVLKLTKNQLHNAFEKIIQSAIRYE